MAWHGIEGHDRVVEQFRRAIQRGRLASSFLFVGPEGIGKRTFALRLAQALLCQTRPEAELDPCGTCPACRQAAADNHPDIHVVGKPAEKSALPLEILIGRREHRGREGLCHDIALRPYSGKRRIAVIDDADYLQVESANSLLKTLEEPPPKSVLILIGTSAARQLPTIRSRCQMVRFDRLPEETVAQLLRREGLLDQPDRAEQLASYSEGSLTQARELDDPDLWSFRGTLLAHLAESPLRSVELAKTMSAFVDAAGKAAPPRRARLRQIVRFATQFYRQLLLSESGANVVDDEELRRAAQQTLAAGTGSQRTLFRLDRCLEAAEQIDRNANQTTLIECWLDDLAGAPA